MTKTERDRKIEIEQRLRQIAPGQWKELSQDEKTYAVNQFYHQVWQRRVTARETLRNVAGQGLTFGMFVIGTLLAIVAGLVVNILHDYLKQFGIVYQIGAPILFTAMLYITIKILDNRIIEEYRDNKFLDELLKNYRPEK